MTGHQAWINRINKRSQATEMDTVNPAGTADRNPDRVHRHRKVFPRIEKKLCRMWIGEKVFRMDFEPGRFGRIGRKYDRWGGHDFRQMRQPQTNAGADRPKTAR